MNFNKNILPLIIGLLTFTAGLLTSCDSINEDLPPCRLYIQFKYDYNMLSVDAFATQVDKVELFVFDKEGKFLFSQTDEGSALATGDYRMRLDIPLGQYKLMAWAGVHDSYDVAALTPGSSTIEEVKLRLKRTSSLIIDQELEPLWYGEIKEINFTGVNEDPYIINLIKDTNNVRFVFQGVSETARLDMEDYSYQIIESNGYMDYDNSLLEDNTLSYQPFYKEQKSPSAILVELNTLRLMSGRKTRFVVTEKATNREVFNINLIDFLAMTEKEGHSWGLQEYFDRQDEYRIVFFFAEGADWTATRIQINGWTWYRQEE